jgi:VIT1/CCC1 family predicted Fe2+/Mn2+ transporter
VSDLEMWSLIVGFALPPVLSVIQQSNWSDRLRAVVAFAACAVAGAGVAYFQGDLTGERFVEAGLVVLVSALATYRNFWKPTGVSPAIEAKTNV